MPAPPGNQNALKHGLYSKRIDKAAMDAAGEVPALAVAQEIAVVRYVLEKILQDLEKTELIEDRARLYNSLFIGVTSLNTIVRSHAILTGQDPEHEKELEAGASYAREKLGINFYLSGPPQQSQRKGKKAR